MQILLLFTFFGQISKLILNLKFAKLSPLHIDFTEEHFILFTTYSRYDWFLIFFTVEEIG